MALGVQSARGSEADVKATEHHTALGIGSLFTWHTPLPHVNAGRAAADARTAALESALRSVDGESPNRAAIELITAEPPAPAGEAHTMLEAHAEDLDPLIRAAVLQRLALSILDTHRPGKHGKRTDVFPPERAFEAINEALGVVDREISVLAAETPGADALNLVPPEVCAELTITFIRAALTVGAVGPAQAATDSLTQRAESITADHVRFHALTSAAVAYLNDGRPDEALIPAQRARSLARQIGDLTGVWRAERIRAHAASLTGRVQGEEAAHREVAALARRLADDLATEASVRAEATLSELESRSVLVRIGLNSGRLAFADDHAAGILDRVTKAVSAKDAPVVRLWEHEIDARIARMIIAGLPDSPHRGKHCAREEAPTRGRRRIETPTESEPLTIDERHIAYDKRRREAREAIANAPKVARDRALWWNAYLDDRHAYLLAANGRFKRALRIANRAHEAWNDLGDAEQAERSAADIARIEVKLAEKRAK